MVLVVVVVVVLLLLLRMPQLLLLGVVLLTIVAAVRHVHGRAAATALVGTCGRRYERHLRAIYGAILKEPWSFSGFPSA